MTHRKQNAFNIVDEGTQLDGSLSFNGKSVINGVLKGNVTATHITIGLKGTIDAEVFATDLIVAGKLSGKIKVAERLVVLASGTCSGEVTCKDLMVEPGGVLNAQVQRIKSPASPAPSKK